MRPRRRDRRPGGRAGGAAGKGDVEWAQNALLFRQEKRMAETANIESYDPLLHGGSSGRAEAKIREREKAMLSMRSEAGAGLDE